MEYTSKILKDHFYLRGQRILEYSGELFGGGGEGWIVKQIREKAKTYS